VPEKPVGLSGPYIEVVWAVHRGPTGVIVRVQHRRARPSTDRRSRPCRWTGAVARSHARRPKAWRACYCWSTGAARTAAHVANA
jgi:hypothetical protein